MFQAISAGMIRYWKRKPCCRNSVGLNIEMPCTAALRLTTTTTKTSSMTC